MKVTSCQFLDPTSARNMDCNWNKNVWFELKIPFLPKDIFNSGRKATWHHSQLRSFFNCWNDTIRSRPRQQLQKAKFWCWKASRWFQSRMLLEDQHIKWDLCRKSRRTCRSSWMLCTRKPPPWLRGCLPWSRQRTQSHQSVPSSTSVWIWHVENLKIYCVQYIFKFFRMTHVDSMIHQDHTVNMMCMLHFPGSSLRARPLLTSWSNASWQLQRANTCWRSMETRMSHSDAMVKILDLFVRQVPCINI